MEIYAAQAFEIYFKKSVIDAAHEVEIKDNKHLHSDCESWLCDLQIIDEPRNERIKQGLERKIQKLFDGMSDLVYEQIELVFAYSGLDCFLDKYFSSLTHEYKIGKYFARLEEEDIEELQKIAQLARDNKDLVTQLLIGKKVIDEVQPQKPTR